MFSEICSLTRSFMENIRVMLFGVHALLRNISFKRCVNINTLWIYLILNLPGVYINIHSRTECIN